MNNKRTGEIDLKDVFGVVRRKDGSTYTINALPGGCAVGPAQAEDLNRLRAWARKAEAEIEAARAGSNQ